MRRKKLWLFHQRGEGGGGGGGREPTGRSCFMDSLEGSEMQLGWGNGYGHYFRENKHSSEKLRDPTTA